MREFEELAREYPGLNITISVSDLLLFGEKLVANTMAATRADETTRIKESEAEELLTDAEACQLFGVSKQTLWRWRKRGYLEGIAVGGRIKYRKEECRRIISKAGDHE